VPQTIAIIAAMNTNLIHEVLPVGMLQCNCSILGDTLTCEAIVVDPGDDVDRIVEILKRHQLKVRAIVSTHTHIDHVGGLAKLHRLSGAPVLIHRDDLELYLHLNIQADWLGVETPEVTSIKDFVKDGDVLSWGGFGAQVLHTPGHTPGSISLVVDSKMPRGADEPATLIHESKARPPHISSPVHLIAGDTLFQGSIGRTDLWGGSYPQILNSIREKLLILPEDALVYPGHGSLTTIGAERANNPFLR
jgi:hydroxyacylglutathione hydrolase